MKAHNCSVILVLAIYSAASISQMDNDKPTHLSTQPSLRIPMSGRDILVAPQTAFLISATSELADAPLPVLGPLASPMSSSAPPAPKGGAPAGGLVLVPPKLSPVYEHITVTPANVDPDGPDQVMITSQTRAVIRSAAGAYSDVPRYLQMLPGVAFDNDARNSFLVRGGNPSENYLSSTALMCRT